MLLLHHVVFDRVRGLSKLPQPADTNSNFRLKDPQPPDLDLRSTNIYIHIIIHIQVNNGCLDLVHVINQNLFMDFITRFSSPLDAVPTGIPRWT
jgi:hypothetical protein